MAAHLSNVASATRKILEFLVIGILAVILLFVVFNIAVLLKNIFLPSPPPAPTVSFGKLSFLGFPQTFDTQNYTYTINTLSGTLPKLPDRITVYKLQQPAANLLGLDKAKDIAKAAKFVDNPIALSDISYKWTRNDPLPTTLTIDIQSLDFFLTSSYATNKTVSDAAHIPDEILAQTISSQFFTTVMPLPDSIDVSKTKTTLLATSANKLIPASSLSSAQIIRIDYFPKPIDTFSIYTPSPDKSLIYSLIASGETDFPQLVEAQYYHKNVSQDKGTYPIKSSAAAYEQLKSGKAFIAANPTGTTNVSITSVGLGYYIDTNPNTYLWPIIVFQGDKGFYAYVSAVTDEWVQK